MAPTPTTSMYKASSSSSQASDWPKIGHDIDIELDVVHHRRSTGHLGAIENYFSSPRDPTRHSKWPYFLRLQGSILPKMLVSLFFVGVWATAVTLVSNYVWDVGIKSNLLTVTGFVVGLAISFRSSTAYERFSEGRKLWAQLLLTSRNLARLIYVHARERHDESPEQGKQDLLAKLAALNLLKAFAVSLKHRLRFEPSVAYPDLAPLVSNLHTFAGDADQTHLRELPVSFWQRIGQNLGLPFAEDNPRYLVKHAKDNLGNTPLEILTYLSAYIETCFQNKLLPLPGQQTQAMVYLAALTEVLTGAERVVNTPLPIAYTVAVSQITWAYVLVLPFQLENSLRWITIPATLVAGYIILSLAQIGRELENPFGTDANDLPLELYCQEIADDIHVLTSEPPPLNLGDWMKESGGSKILWPLSGEDFRNWEKRSIDDVRGALRARAKQCGCGRTE